MTHVIVLNLERSDDRKDKLLKQFKKSRVKNYTFFPGFDGKAITNRALDNVPIIKGVGQGRNLQKAEVAVILSHIAILKHAQVMNYEHVVVLEDDVSICDDWDHRMEILLKSLPSDWEYVYLSGHSDYVTIPKYDEPTIMHAPKMIGAFSYLVNKQGIKKLIKYCSELVTTYDDMIMHAILEKKMTGYLYLPYMTYHSGTHSLLWDKPPGHLAHKNNMHSSYDYFKPHI